MDEMNTVVAEGIEAMSKTEGIPKKWILIGGGLAILALGIGATIIVKKSKVKGPDGHDEEIVSIVTDSGEVSDKKPVNA